MSRYERPEALDQVMPRQQRTIESNGRRCSKDVRPKKRTAKTGYAQGQQSQTATPKSTSNSEVGDSLAVRMSSGASRLRAAPCAVHGSDQDHCLPSRGKKHRARGRALRSGRQTAGFRLRSPLGRLQRAIADSRGPDTRLLRSEKQASVSPPRMLRPQSAAG